MEGMGRRGKVKIVELTFLLVLSFLSASPLHSSLQSTRLLHLIAMASLPSIRCCLNALGSTSRSTRGARLPQPQPFILPSLFTRSISQQPSSSSSDDTKSTTSSPIVPSPPPSSTPSSPPTSEPRTTPERITFSFKFSSITTSDTLARVLKVRRSVTPSKIALLPELEQRQHKAVLRILAKASEMDPEQRAAYFVETDGGHLVSEGLKQSQRERAKELVESGLCDEEDALSAEEYEEKLRVKGEARMKKLIETKGWSREKALKEMRKDGERSRRRRLERLEVRREMKESE